MARLRNTDFITFCKELRSKGYTQPAIAKKAIEKFSLPSCSTITVFRALHYGHGQIENKQKEKV